MSANKFGIQLSTRSSSSGNKKSFVPPIMTSPKMIGSKLNRSVQMMQEAIEDQYNNLMLNALMSGNRSTTHTNKRTKVPPVIPPLNQLRLGTSPVNVNRSLRLSTSNQPNRGWDSSINDALNLNAESERVELYPNQFPYNTKLYETDIGSSWSEIRKSFKKEQSNNSLDTPKGGNKTNVLDRLLEKQIQNHPSSASKTVIINDPKQQQHQDDEEEEEEIPRQQQHFHSNKYPFSSETKSIDRYQSYNLQTTADTQKQKQTREQQTDDDPEFRSIKTEPSQRRTREYKFKKREVNQANQEGLYNIQVDSETQQPSKGNLVKIRSRKNTKQSLGMNGKEDSQLPQDDSNLRQMQKETRIQEESNTRHVYQKDKSVEKIVVSLNYNDQRRNVRGFEGGIGQSLSNDSIKQIPMHYDSNSNLSEKDDTIHSLTEIPNSKTNTYRSFQQEDIDQLESQRMNSFKQLDVQEANRKKSNERTGSKNEMNKSLSPEALSKNFPNQAEVIKAQQQEIDRIAYKLECTKSELDRIREDRNRVLIKYSEEAKRSSDTIHELKADRDKQVQSHEEEMTLKNREIEKLKDLVQTIQEEKSEEEQKLQKTINKLKASYDEEDQEYVEDLKSKQNELLKTKAEFDHLQEIHRLEVEALKSKIGNYQAQLVAADSQMQVELLSRENLELEVEDLRQRCEEFDQDHLSVQKKVQETINLLKGKHQQVVEEKLKCDEKWKIKFEEDQLLHTNSMNILVEDLNRKHEDEIKKLKESNQATSTLKEKENSDMIKILKAQISELELSIKDYIKKLKTQDTEYKQRVSTLTEEFEFRVTDIQEQKTSLVLELKQVKLEISKNEQKQESEIKKLKEEVDSLSSKNTVLIENEAFLNSEIEKIKQELLASLEKSANNTSMLHLLQAQLAEAKKQQVKSPVKVDQLTKNFKKPTDIKSIGNSRLSSVESKTKPRDEAQEKTKLMKLIEENEDKIRAITLEKELLLKQQQRKSDEAFNEMESRYKQEVNILKDTISSVQDQLKSFTGGVNGKLSTEMELSSEKMKNQQLQSLVEAREGRIAQLKSEISMATLSQSAEVTALKLALSEQSKQMKSEMQQVSDEQLQEHLRIIERMKKEFHSMLQIMEQRMKNTEIQLEDTVRLLDERPSRNEDIQAIRDLYKQLEMAARSREESALQVHRANEIVKYLQLELENYKTTYGIFGPAAGNITSTTSSLNYMRKHVSGETTRQYPLIKPIIGVGSDIIDSRQQSQLISPVRNLIRSSDSTSPPLPRKPDLASIPSDMRVQIQQQHQSDQFEIRNQVLLKNNAESLIDSLLPLSRITIGNSSESQKNNLNRSFNFELPSTPQKASRYATADATNTSKTLPVRQKRSLTQADENPNNQLDSIDRTSKPSELLSTTPVKLPSLPTRKDLTIL